MFVKVVNHGVWVVLQDIIWLIIYDLVIKLLADVRRSSIFPVF